MPINEGNSTSNRLLEGKKELFEQEKNHPNFFLHCHTTYSFVCRI
jgi:hypothetical protein